MKHLAIIALFALHSSLFTLFAAVPLRWTVETSRATPATFEAYQGETLDFEAALQSYGKPIEAPSNYSFFWQTNGMGNLYWEAPADPNGEAVSHRFNSGPTNVLFATWLPSYDVGARVYNCFIGSPSNNYHTAFQLRLRPSPGATPNALPLPVPVIDFAKVRVLNPPWSGGGGGGVDTNAVRDIVRPMIADATNGIRSVDGAARPLPKYLHLYNADDSYPDEAAEYYAQRGSGVSPLTTAQRGSGVSPLQSAQCSSVRDGGFLYRNFDFPFDDRAEFVVRMSAGPSRFASVGVAQVGTNLTEQFVTSGRPSRCYKWLPGATVDGINENGVACNINVVDGDPQWGSGVSPLQALHPLAAIRWILDNATNAQHAATYIASHIVFPQGWTQNYHYMVADERDTYIVENGRAHNVGEPAVMTNFSLYPDYGGMGWERFRLLALGANITNAWYTNAYRRETNPPWTTDLADVLDYTNEIFNAWAEHPKEYFRGKTTNGQPWWQTVHTSVYDLTNRVLRVAVQEVDDWYVFQVPSSDAKVDSYTKAETDGLLSDKLDKEDVVAPSTEESASGKAADAKATADALAEKIGPGDEVDPVFEQWVTGEDAKTWLEYNETDPTIPNWAKAENPPWFDDGLGNLMFYGNVGGWAYGGLGNPQEDGYPKIIPDQTGGPFIVRDSVNGTWTLMPPPDISGKFDTSRVSSTDQTFTNAVIETMKGVTPQPSPTLRLYDEVRQCWWIGKMVNGVMQWEVE